MNTKIENKVFYHIQRNPTWEVGNEYQTFDDRNYFSDFLRKNGMNCRCSNFSNSAQVDINPVTLAKELLDVSNGKEKSLEISPYFHYDPIKTIEILEKSLSEYMKFTREIIFEEVRKEFFRDKPSRQNCIWLIEDDTMAIKYWLTILKNDWHKLFKVEATGIIHIADQKYLDLSADPLDELQATAKNYWQSAKLRNPTVNECVFKGKIKVIAEEEIKKYL